MPKWCRNVNGIYFVGTGFVVLRYPLQPVVGRRFENSTRVVVFHATLSFDEDIKNLSDGVMEEAIRFGVGSIG